MVEITESERETERQRGGQRASENGIQGERLKNSEQEKETDQIYISFITIALWLYPL